MRDMQALYEEDAERGQARGRRATGERARFAQFQSNWLDARNRTSERDPLPLMGEPKTYGQWSFNGGELSPRMHRPRRPERSTAIRSRRCSAGCRCCRARQRQRRERSTSRPPRAVPPVPVRVFPTQGYVIEASAGKFRFYTNDARIETAPGVPYEVAHPYAR
jgi:hypothetical protein